MDLIKAIELFATITGILYVILEIGQKNAMWIVGILTGIACSYSFSVQRLWASMGLNIYYVFVSVWGLHQWRKDASKASGERTIHLRRPTLKVLLLSLLLFLVSSAALIAILRLLGDSESALDAVVTIASAIGTWWLAKSYPQQWIVWICADLLLTVLCLRTGLYWMSMMYLAYFLSAIYGLYHWMKKGTYIDENE